MEKVITENRNQNTIDIDLISTEEIIKKINEEDKKVAVAVEKETKNIAKAVDLIVESYKKQGKLFYFGAGTSGRLGVLDASECPPTFGVGFDMVQGIIAGGDEALRFAIEGAEDNYALGQKDGNRLSKKDCCVLISASGNPKYLLGVADSAKKKNAKIIALTSNPKAEILKLCDVGICVIVGAETITGSSRMKAGTAQKMVLNMLTTVSMVKIGKTYENYMIDVKATNEKLKKRAISIVCDLCNVDENTAHDTLKNCDWQVKTAVVMIKKNVTEQVANDLLKENDGILRKVIYE